MTQGKSYSIYVLLCGNFEHRMGSPKVQIQDAFLHLRTNVTYRLIGAILHQQIGSNGGHYMCYFADHVHATWFYANDDKVHTI